MIRCDTGPSINVSLPGARVDRQAYARVCGHVTVQTSRLVSLPEGVTGMTSIALRLGARSLPRGALAQVLGVVRSSRHEDLGYRRPSGNILDDLEPPVQVRVPRSFQEHFDAGADAELSWLHSNRRMSFKEFVKLTMLVGDVLFTQSERARRFVGSVWPVPK